MNTINAIKLAQGGENEKPSLKTAHPISHFNWDYKAEVRADFGIAYDEDNIYLEFDVTENDLQAKCTETNGSVWEDSCVEFFISFDGESHYNFEFNCIGTVLGGYGKGRKDRTRFDKALLEKISRTSSLGNSKITILDREINWKLSVAIPISTFIHTEITSLEGKEVKANFYKCGDKLPHPHFLSWNPVLGETPDFHQVQFFGTLLFP